MLLEKPAEKVILVVLLYAHELLVDSIDGWRLRGNHHLHGILHEFARQLENLGGERRRKEHRLLLHRQLRQHAADIGKKSHVEHAIGFVQNEVFDLVEIHLTLRHQVDETSRRCNHDFGAAPDILHLAILVHAAEHAGEFGVRILGVLHVVLARLGGEFARGTQHESARVSRLVARNLGIGEPFDYREQEGGSLACACLRAADKIAPFQQRRNGLLLDWGGRRIPKLRNRIAKALVKSVEHCFLDLNHYTFLSIAVARGRNSVSSPSFSFTACASAFTPNVSVA